MKKTQQPRSRKIKNAVPTTEPTKATSRKRTKLDDVIAAELANDPSFISSETETVVPYVGPDSAMSEEAKALYQTSLEKIYGKPGVPDNDNILPFVLPPSISKPADRVAAIAEADKIIALREARLAEQKAKEDSEKMSMVTPKHSVTVMKNPGEPYPELWWKVFIQGPRWEHAAFADMFTRAKCSRADSIAEADLVVFTGGADVNPALYGAKPHHASSWDDARDTADINAYLECYEAGIPMLGICRGAQFLHVMQGGKLYQDVEGHQGDHRIFDRKGKDQILASSVHHQLVVKDESIGMEVLATSMKAAKHKYLDNETKVIDPVGADVEVFFYEDTMVLGVQGHPEYKNYPEFTKYVIETMVECFATNPDMIFVRPDGDKGPMYLRIKPDVLAQRKDQVLRPAAAKMD